MPRKLEITTIVPCVNNCSYCAQSALKKSIGNMKKKMSFEDFKRAMANVPKDIIIEFAGFSEAFPNKESSLMMKYCVDQGYETHIYTTLVGFTQADADILKGITFDMVSFHVFDGVNMEKFNAAKKLFKENINIKIEREAKLSVETGYSRAGETKEVKEVLGSFYCGSTKEFDHNVLLPNGDVSLCCMDYGLKHIIGNLFETHYDHLDRQHIKDLASKQKSDIICRKCEVMVERYPFPKF